MRKAFGPTIALNSVDFTLHRGEIHGLVGENGSGKSTIMSIVAGMQPATDGDMFFHGNPWRPASMVQAQENGISMILQEANTLPGVTVAQNIFAGHEKDFSYGGFINMRLMNNEAQALLDAFGITHIHAHENISRYSFEDRKLTEIVRCVRENTEVLIVDETTTALSMQGREILFSIMHRMAEKEDKAVVFISHDMDEILSQCTVLTVLRDGEIVGSISSEDISKARIDETARQEVLRRARHMMVGREIGNKYYREDFTPSRRNNAALELRDISFDAIRNFSLTLYEGEIVGLGGLSSCGMHDIGRAAFGLEKLESGTVTRHGKIIRDPRCAIENGIGYISKNRDMEALILSGSLRENIILPSIEKLAEHGFVRPREARKLASGQIEMFSIKCRHSGQYVNTLSGGNKQKVSFAKWTAKGSQVIIMDCPTRGVDVGVKQFMYALMERMKQEGKAILMISEELSELVGMADRLIIMKDFRITKEFKRNAALRQTDIIEHMI